MNIIKIIKNLDFYSFIYNWCWPISFFAMMGILIATGITQNTNIFVIGVIALILFDILCMIYICVYPFEHLDERFILWIHSFHKYKLSEEESKLWNNISNKASNGYIEWFAKTQGDDICGPWISDYNDEERKLVDKIHQYYYGTNWWIATPISGAQVMYVMYEDIKNKVI